MAGVQVSPRSVDKLKKHYSTFRKRNESPKFRDILRERCHARIKASRCALIDKFRNIDNTEEIQSTLSNILKEEIKSLTVTSINSHQSSFVFDDEESEELNEDHWLIEEYDRLLAEEEANFDVDWENQVICPLCEMSVLSINNDCVVCFKCQTQFPYVPSLEMLKYILDGAIRGHNECCSESAQFTVLKDKELGLFLICETCMTFSQVV